MSTPQRSRIAPAFGAAFLMIGLLAVFGSWRGYQLDRAILEHGTRAEGHVTKKIVLAGANGASDHGVDYWFALPGGQRIEAHAGVPEPMWDELREGGTFEIAYSPEYPRRNFPVGGGVTSLGITIFVGTFGAVFAALGGLLIRSYLRSGRKGS